MHFRYSGKPSKQLLWLFLMFDMSDSRGFDVGIDVGCGPMLNRRFFETKRYVGVDLDADRLRQGQARYPEAEAVAGRVEEVSGVHGDFVLSVQMFVNKHFDVDLTLRGVEGLVGMVNPGGTLIFNISKRNFAHEDEIDALLADSFRHVEKVKYGALSARDIGPLALPVALAMLVCPPLRRGRGFQKIYYRCTDRH